MLIRSAALAALIVCAFVADIATADDRLTLDDAMTRVIAYHPDLQIYRYTALALTAQADRAAQKPAFGVAADIENAFGTGSASALRAAELTLSLTSVLERGGKRDARRALAASHIDTLGVQQAGTRLDVLAEVARRYLDLAWAQAQQKIAESDYRQRERTVVAASKRVQAGASAESVLLTAEAMHARSALDITRAKALVDSTWRRLALMWGEGNAQSAPTLPAVILDLPGIQDYSVLAELLERSPELEQFADRSRIHDARLRLARSAASADIDWHVGLRRFQAEDDWGLVAGVSLPLGVARRAEPDIRVAEAERESLDLERASVALSLRATLSEAHGRMLAARAEVIAIRDEVLPRLLRAQSAAERAYRGGALSYMEWAALNSESVAVQRQQLAAAVDAHRALIEIQRLTAEPIVPGGTSDKEPTP